MNDELFPSETKIKICIHYYGFFLENVYVYASLGVRFVNFTFVALKTFV